MSGAEGLKRLTREVLDEVGSRRFTFREVFTEVHARSWQDFDTFVPLGVLVRRYMEGEIRDVLRSRQKTGRKAVRVWVSFPNPDNPTERVWRRFGDCDLSDVQMLRLDRHRAKDELGDVASFLDDIHELIRQGERRGERLTVADVIDILLGP